MTTRFEQAARNEPPAHQLNCTVRVVGILHTSPNSDKMTNQASKMRMDAYEVRGKAYQRYAGRND